jgi:CrcB protein
MTYLWVAIGGALGSVARFGCVRFVTQITSGGFPWGTLAVNVGGSLAIGVLAGLVAADGRALVAGDTRAFLIVGVLGGFTTFSAFSLETFELARGGAMGAALTNAALSVVSCLIAVWAGYALAGALNR